MINIPKIKDLDMFSRMNTDDGRKGNLFSMAYTTRFTIATLHIKRDV